MLGKLFGNAASSLSSVTYRRDSIVDEEYTRGLLFPDHAAAQDASTNLPQVGAGWVGEFDDWSGLELDATKDFRIIIAQDALGDSEEPCILFDTHPIPQTEGQIDLARRTGSFQSSAHRRGGSITSTLRSPTSPMFSKPQQRMSSIGPSTSFPVRNRSSTFSGASDEHDPRHIRSLDLKDETRTILNCAFGSSAGASFGTKMHVLSLGSGAKELPVTPSSPGVGGNISASYFRKREPIARAHTSALSGVRPSVHERSHSSSGPKQKYSDAILITKLFGVNLPEPTDLQPLHSAPPAEGGGAVSNDAEPLAHNSPIKGKKPRAKKTPMFAIILVIQLPMNLSTFSRPPSRSSIQTSSTCAPARSFPNSFSSYSSSPKFAASITPTERGDARVNALVEHWDVIDRALTFVENVSAPTILGHLKKVESFSAAFISKPSKPKEKTMQRTNQINIYLVPLIMISDPNIKDTAMQAVHRIRRALRIPRATVGQGRWGLWSDELIRIARYYDGKEQNSFILNLLTSFLGAHTAEWMTLLAPSLHHRRRPVARKTNDSGLITTRTVVVSNDRSIARRLVFLLSSFLPGGTHCENGGALRRGPGSAVSLRNAIVHPAFQETSTNPQRSCSPERHQGHSLEHPRGGLIISRGVRRKPSDINSIKSIPIPASDLSLKKSSAATTSTVTPNPTTPVPQFSSSLGPESAYFPDESSASASLTKIWQTANRDSESSTASTKWGSLLSGFWSKDSSANTSESTAASTSSSIRFQKGTHIDNMLKELAVDEDTTISVPTNDSSYPIESFASQASPLKLQVSADEGVIDVDIGIPGFLSSSNDSILTSPPLRNVRHVSSVASFDSLASSKRHFSPKGGSSLQSRVAGFLPKFHPDYSVQAVRANKSEIPNIVENIKRAMLSEPYSQELTMSGWVDVSTTLIANVQTASVKRLRLKRKVSRVEDPIDNKSPATPGVEQSTAPRAIKPSSPTCGEFLQEEAFSYETVTDVDPLLSEVLERVLVHDGTHGPGRLSPEPSSHSRQPSTGTSGSHIGSHKHRNFNVSQSPDGFARGFAGSLVVGALEDIVKSVNHDLMETGKRQHLVTGMKGQSAAQTKEPEENALREGVRSWLLNAEHTTVW